MSDKKPKAIFTITINVFPEQGISEPIPSAPPKGFVSIKKIIPIEIERVISGMAHELSKNLGQIWKEKEINYLIPPEIEVNVEYEGGSEASLIIKVENDIPA